MRRLRDAPCSLSALLTLEARALWDVCVFKEAGLPPWSILMIPCHFAFALVLPRLLSTLHFFSYISLTPSPVPLARIITTKKFLLNDLDDPFGLNKNYPPLSKKVSLLMSACASNLNFWFLWVCINCYSSNTTWRSDRNSQSLKILLLM